MLRVARQARILQLVKQRGFVETGELAAVFDVSVITIRRDLKNLEGQNLISFERGGATAVDYVHMDVEPLYETKSYMNAGKKEAIVDLTIKVTYGFSVPQLVVDVRKTIGARLLEIAGLIAKEVNIRIVGIDFPDRMPGRVE